MAQAPRGGRNQRGPIEFPPVTPATHGPQHEVGGAHGIACGRGCAISDGVDTCNREAGMDQALFINRCLQRKYTKTCATPRFVRECSVCTVGTFHTPCKLLRSEGQAIGYQSNLAQDAAAHAIVFSKSDNQLHAVLAGTIQQQPIVH